MYILKNLFKKILFLLIFTNLLFSNIGGIVFQDLAVRNTGTELKLNTMG